MFCKFFFILLICFKIYFNEPKNSDNVEDRAESIRELNIPCSKNFREKSFTKLMDELIKRTSASRQKRLSQLLHEQRLGDSTPSPFSEKSSMFSWRGKLRESSTPYFSPACSNGISRQWGGAYKKKLASMENNMADLISQAAVSILSMQTPERTTSLDRILEGVRKLEVRKASKESCLKKKEK